MIRVNLTVKVISVFNNHIVLKDTDGEKYNWFTRSYTSPLLNAEKDVWFNISATKYAYDFPTPKNGLKNVRIIKGSD